MSVDSPESLQYARDAFHSINRIRRREGLDDLLWDQSLENASKYHAGYWCENYKSGDPITVEDDLHKHDDPTTIEGWNAASKRGRAFGYENTYIGASTSNGAHRRTADEIIEWLYERQLETAIRVFTDPEMRDIGVAKCKRWITVHMAKKNNNPNANQQNQQPTNTNANQQNQQQQNNIVIRINGDASTSCRYREPKCCQNGMVYTAECQDGDYNYT